MSLLMGTAMAASGQISPGSLRVEHLSENILIDAPTDGGAQPRFSWINTAGRAATGEEQTAYRICVATSPAKLARPDVWDSKRVKSADSYLVAYKGPALQEGTDYWWRVMVWSKKGKASAWSEPQQFTTGITDWQATWIGAPWQGEEPQHSVKTGQNTGTAKVPYLRTTFNVDKKVKSAKVFVTGLGYFEFFLNGKKVGNDLLVPNFTNYTARPDVKYYKGLSLDEKSSGFRVSYLKYDITPLLRQGKNAAGAMIAGGYFDNRSVRVGAFGSPRFLCKIVVDYADGSRLNVCSSPQTWKAHESGIVDCELYEGENYDARKEIPDWCSPGYDDSGWQNAAERKAPDGKLRAFDSRPDRITATFNPREFKDNGDGTYTIDFGEMISGHVRLKGIRGEAGKTIKIRYDSKYPEEVSYTFKDSAPVEYAPQFTWYVFRTVTISGIVPTADQIVAEAVNTDMRLNSEFTTSNALFNRISHVWQRTEDDNIHSGVESDCPHRERLPYTGDGQAVCSTVMHNYDGTAFYRSWFSTMRDAQDRETGYVPNSAPWCVAAGGGVGWGAAMTLMPWEYYMSYGDKRVIEENYDAAKRQVEYMLTWVRPDGTMHQKRKNAIDGSDCYWMNLGDWVPPYETPADEKVHTYMLWRCADRMARMAKVVGNSADEKRFADLAAKTAEAYNSVFYENDQVGFGDFGPNVLAVEMGLNAKRPQLKGILADEIGVRHGGHINCGYLSFQVMLECLAGIGLNDLAYTVMNKTDFPSFGEMIKKGSTTIWENFQGDISENHPFYGCGFTWFYRTLAGVNADPAAPGYKHVIVRPVLTDSLESASYSQVTPYGKVASAVSHSPGRVNVSVEVPVGSTATVYVPAPGFAKASVATAATPGKAARKDIEKIKAGMKKTPEGFTVELPQGRYDITAEK